MILKSAIRPLFSKKLKPHTIQAGPLRGKRIVTSWYDYPAAILGYAEDSLLRWIMENVKAGETWLDIGAHYGYTSLAFCEKVGQAGRVIAFEPYLPTVVCLHQTKSINKLSQWTIMPFALSSHSQFTFVNLPVTRGMVDSQLLNQGTEDFGQVISLSLDFLWRNTATELPHIHGMKIDVQGMEIDVLLGMKETLRTFRPKLIIEVHPSVSRGRLLEILADAGYAKEAIAIERDKMTDFYDPESNYSFLFVPMP